MSRISISPLNPMTSRIGYLGLGDMGGAIASRLVEAGWALALYARREASLAPFRSTGAAVCSDPREVAGSVDALCICVGDTSQVEDVLFGTAGVAASLQENAIVIVQSTIKPQACKDFADRLSARGVQLIDAPVTGGNSRARAGTLTIPCGGDPDVIARARPLLEDQATLVIHVGEVGSGQVLKLLNNSVYTANLALALEATRLGEAMGLDREQIWQVLGEGSGGSAALTTYARNMREQGEMFPGTTAYAGGASGLLSKDVGLLQHMLQQAGLDPSPLGTFAREAISAIMAHEPPPAG